MKGYRTLIAVNVKITKGESQGKLPTCYKQYLLFK